MAHARVMRGWRQVAMAAALLATASCRDDAAPRVPSAGTATTAAKADGEWLGGPEAASGKLRSGIVSWWRLDPAKPEPGVPFELTLRLDEIKADDASAAVAASDGARLADAQARREWTLPAGQPALITLKLVAPAGDSYLHLTTRQQGRSSVRSIRLGLPGGSAAAAEPQASSVDARGDPIVRMQSGH